MSRNPDTKLLPAPKSRNNTKLYVFTMIAAGMFFALSSIIIFNEHFKRPAYQQEVKPERTVKAGDPVKPEQIEEIDPIRILKENPPEINANAYGVFYMDKESGEFKELYTQNPELSLPPASITKMMTAVIAIEQFDLDQKVTVPSNCVNLNAATVGFASGDVFTVEDLLYGLLVRSGADAACTIANVSNEAYFIQAMNRKADELGMTKTSFANEIGFDSENYQFSSVSDLKKLTEYALQYKTFQKIVGTRSFTLREVNTGRNYTVNNTNDLLSTIPGTVGVKTGYTDDAGECLSYLYENKGQEIMIIILGSQNRFGDTSKLLDWAKTELEEI